MGSIGDYIVDINKVLFGSIQGSLGAAGSDELGASIYKAAQDFYHGIGLDSLRG
ncbi:hypothetical protein [Tomitella gaofuii]|uniref:hypothetical protein n=1 Tax=Tomitella gaofuii TaxID=2760083 RepID=UPI0015FCB5AF|nr:hypothetical protein [Tomitella gaofuii]